MIKHVAIALCILIITGCAANQETEDDTMEKVSFITEDGVAIVGNYWKGSSTGVLLLHMMPTTKESWNRFAEVLNIEGMSVLAIDLRGHGESMKHNGHTLDYNKFTDQQHQSSILDVEASIAYLKEHGATTIYITGASIGANLALQYQSEHSDITKTILLSPGTNYRGIITEPFAKQLQEDQAVFFVAGAKDGRAAGSADAMARQIADNIKGKKQVKIYETASHGTDLFNDDPQLIPMLVQWLKT